VSIGEKFFSGVAMVLLILFSIAMGDRADYRKHLDWHHTNQASPCPWKIAEAAEQAVPR
jgi:hypothetical protein